MRLITRRGLIGTAAACASIGLGSGVARLLASSRTQSADGLQLTSTTSQCPEALDISVAQEMSDGRIIYLGNRWVTPSEFGVGIIPKVGAPTWTKIGTNTDRHNKDYVGSITRLRDDRFLATTMPLDSPHGIGAKVVIFDGNGLKLRENFIKPESDDPRLYMFELTDSLMLSDGCVVFGECTSEDGQRYAWIVRFDVDGEAVRQALVPFPSKTGWGTNGTGLCQTSWGFVGMTTDTFNTTLWAFDRDLKPIGRKMVPGYGACSGGTQADDNVVVIMASVDLTTGPTLLRFGRSLVPIPGPTIQGPATTLWANRAVRLQGDRLAVYGRRAEYHIMEKAWFGCLDLKTGESSGRNGENVDTMGSHESARCLASDPTRSINIRAKLVTVHSFKDQTNIIIDKVGVSNV